MAFVLFGFMTLYFLCCGREKLLVKTNKTVAPHTEALIPNDKFDEKAAETSKIEINNHNHTNNTDISHSNYLPPMTIN